MEVFSKRLRELRSERGENQLEVATFLDVSSQSYSAYEMGREPKYEILVKLCKRYGVSADYLLGLTDTRKPESAAAVDELGLTDKAVTRIKAMAEEVVCYDPNDESDTTSGADVLSDMLEDDAFSKSFVPTFSILCMPGIENLPSSEITTLVGTQSVSGERFIRLQLDETLDGIIVRVRNKNTR